MFIFVYFSILLFSTILSCISERLMFIGDSFDREFVRETCYYYESIGEKVNAYEWGKVKAFDCI